VPRDAQQAVYEALLADRQLKAAYQRRYDKTAAEYVLNPLAIVQRGPVIYLVATRADSMEKIRLFALHRFVSAEVLKTAAVSPEDFHVDDYLESGAMGFGQGEPVRLRALFEAKAGEHLYECRLSEDQVITEQEDGRLLVEATVRNTAQLVWWLRGFGSAVEVVEPGLGL